MKSDSKPKYDSHSLKIFEWPYPLLEIHDKNKHTYIHIDNPDDAKAVIISLISMLNSIPFEFGGYKND